MVRLLQKRKIIGLTMFAGFGTAILVLAVFFSTIPLTDSLPDNHDNNNNNNDTMPSDTHANTVQDADVYIIMPVKVSRPGCEQTDRCYVPPVVTIKKGDTVTWKNEDSAFHSVTSGTYGAPTGMFDSGYMDPYEQYSLTFYEFEIIEYFCTLHPWMQGVVIVGE